MVDALFAEPRLAAVYDPLDPDGRDLDAYVAMARELRARRVLGIALRQRRLRVPARPSRAGGDPRSTPGRELVFVPRRPPR